MDRTLRVAVEPTAKNVEQIARLEAEHLLHRSVAERLAGAVTAAAGTATCALLHVVWFGGWILVNLGRVHGVAPFDPFPFGLLTTIVSLEAIFLAICILINQNQMTRQADRRAHLDLQVNLLAEQESTATLRIVSRIAERLGIDLADCTPDRSLATETDVERLAAAMDEALTPPDSSGSPKAPAS
jgi:uncharacterized membrane protein